MKKIVFVREMFPQQLYKDVSQYFANRKTKLRTSKLWDVSSRCSYTFSVHRGGLIICSPTQSQGHVDTKPLWVAEAIFIGGCQSVQSAEGMQGSR